MEYAQLTGLKAHNIMMSLWKFTWRKALKSEANLT